MKRFHSAELLQLRILHESSSYPEDIGGPWGYQELVAAMKTGRGTNNNHWRQINGYRFDPAAFDLEETNRDLTHWAKKHDQK